MQRPGCPICSKHKFLFCDCCKTPKSFQKKVKGGRDATQRLEAHRAKVDKKDKRRGVRVMVNHGQRSERYRWYDEEGASCTKDVWETIPFEKRREIEDPHWSSSLPSQWQMSEFNNMV